MGTSTDAILFYGFSAEDEGDWDKRLEDDWTDTFAAHKGVLSPDSGNDAFNAYWSKKSQLLAAEPCEIDQHCSGAHPISFVYIAESKITASRGDAKEVGTIWIGERWRDQLKEFCNLMGIPWQEPKWYLVSYWG